MDEDEDVLGAAAADETPPKAGVIPDATAVSDEPAAQEQKQMGFRERLGNAMGMRGREAQVATQDEGAQGWRQPAAPIMIPIQKLNEMLRMGFDALIEKPSSPGLGAPTAAPPPMPEPTEQIGMADKGSNDEGVVPTQSAAPQGRMATMEDFNRAFPDRGRGARVGHYPTQENPDVDQQGVINTRAQPEPPPRVNAPGSIEVQDPNYRVPLFDKNGDRRRDTMGGRQIPGVPMSETRQGSQNLPTESPEWRRNREAGRPNRFPDVTSPQDRQVNAAHNRQMDLAQVKANATRDAAETRAGATTEAAGVRAKTTQDQIAARQQLENSKRDRMERALMQRHAHEDAMQQRKIQAAFAQFQQSEAGRLIRSGNATGRNPQEVDKMAIQQAMRIGLDPNLAREFVGIMRAGEQGQAPAAPQQVPQAAPQQVPQAPSGSVSPRQGGFPRPGQGAVQILRNGGSKEWFEHHYGPGSAQQWLGQ